MKLRFKILLLSLSLYFISGTVFTGTEISSQPYNPDNLDPNIQFYIASIDLGSYDLADADTVILLADIVSRFEVVALQGIQPATAKSALQELIEKTNAYDHPYEYLIDSFTEDTTARYAYIYRTDIVYPVQWYSYSGTRIDKSDQAPLIVRFESNDGDFDFTLINYKVNVKPTSPGIDSLSLLVNDVKGKFPDESDIIILGPTDTNCERATSDDPLLWLNQEDFICLVDDDKAEREINGSHANPQIIIAAYSDELFWEEGEQLFIEESSAVLNSQVESTVDQPGFSNVIVVKAGDNQNNDSKTRGGCFFNSTSN